MNIQHANISEQIVIPCLSSSKASARRELSARSRWLVIAGCIAIGSFCPIASADVATTQPVQTSAGRPATQPSGGPPATASDPIGTVTKGINLVNSATRLANTVSDATAEKPPVPPVPESVPELAPEPSPGPDISGLESDEGETALGILAFILELLGGF
jgi:hypothetical protein